MTYFPLKMFPSVSGPGGKISHGIEAEGFVSDIHILT